MGTVRQSRGRLRGRRGEAVAWRPRPARGEAVAQERPWGQPRQVGRGQLKGPASLRAHRCRIWWLWPLRAQATPRAASGGERAAKSARPGWQLTAARNRASSRRAVGRRERAAVAAGGQRGRVGGQAAGGSHETVADKGAQPSPMEAGATSGSWRWSGPTSGPWRCCKGHAQPRMPRPRARTPTSWLCSAGTHRFTTRGARQRSWRTGGGAVWRHAAWPSRAGRRARRSPRPPWLRRREGQPAPTHHPEEGSPEKRTACAQSVTEASRNRNESHPQRSSAQPPPSSAPSPAWRIPAWLGHLLIRIAGSGAPLAQPHPGSSPSGIGRIARPGWQSRPGCWSGRRTLHR